MSRSGLLARATGRASATPGPGAYNSTRQTGTDSPSWTFKSRHEVTSHLTTAPYRALPSSIGAGPKISFSSRHGTRETTDGPGPSYIPPSLGDNGPKFSMSSRHQTTRDLGADTPGPGAYNPAQMFAKEAPKFSMRGRTALQEAGDASPGPAAYLPDYNSVKKKAPSSTMHVRTPMEKTEITPGPSDYQISRNLGGTAPTLHGRPKDPAAAHQTPGPGAYDVEKATASRAPAYTMKSRHFNEARPITAPYRALPSSIGQGPKISMSSRHGTREVADTPGPSYIPPALGSNSKKVSMASRMSETRDSRLDNPGPGAYSIQPAFAKEAPSFTLKSRTKNLNEPDSSSPGPGGYYPNWDATKKRAPSATMHIRPAVKDASESAGYVDLGSTLTGPKYTIGRRENLDLVQV